MWSHLQFSFIYSFVCMLIYSFIHFLISMSMCLSEGVNTLNLLAFVHFVNIKGHNGDKFCTNCDTLVK